MKAEFLWGLLGIIVFLTCYTKAETFKNYGEQCVISGPLWYYNWPCKSYKGTVHCNAETGIGTCACNQGSDAYWNSTAEKCFVKAASNVYNGTCSSKISPQLDDVECTPNADCISVEAAGIPDIMPPFTWPLGKCVCLYGYKANVNGECEEDPAIDDGERSTRVPRTTTPKPTRERFQLPLLTLLRQVKFDEVCDSKPVLPLNRTICQTYGHTVFCKEHKCQCNMEEDAIFDKAKNKCVSKLGGWCLARTSLLGTKECIQNAECRAEAGKSIDDGYSFGTCQCVKGYMINVENLDECIENPNEPNPETARPPIRWTVPPKPTPTRPDFGDGNTGNHGESIRASITSLILSFVTVLGLFNLI